MDRKLVCLSQLTRSGGQNGLHFGGWLLLEYITDITGDFGFGTPEIDSSYVVALIMLREST